MPTSTTNLERDTPNQGCPPVSSKFAETRANAGLVVGTPQAVFNRCPPSYLVGTPGAPPSKEGGPRGTRGRGWGKKPVSAWLQNQFADTGLELLPDDLRWLDSVLSGIDIDCRADLLNGYALRWLEGMAAEPLPHRKQNRGAYLANCWIRETLAAETLNQPTAPEGLRP